MNQLDDPKTHRSRREFLKRVALLMSAGALGEPSLTFTGFPKINSRPIHTDGVVT